MCTLPWQTNTVGSLCTLSPGLARVGKARLAGRNVHWRAFVAGRVEGSDGVTDPCVSGESWDGFLEGSMLFPHFKVPLKICEQCASGYR